MALGSDRVFCTTAGRRLLICPRLAALTLLPYLQIKYPSFITFDELKFQTDFQPGTKPIKNIA
jgi:hypothetical protein